MSDSAKRKFLDWAPDLGSDFEVLDTEGIEERRKIGNDHANRTWKFFPPKSRMSPKDKVMLQKLSGKSHEVITGVCLSSLNKSISFSGVTKVYFKELSNQEIDFYIEKFKPFDKAGAYGIQEWIGFIGVEKIEGSYFNVMGLPVKLLHEAIMAF